MTRLIILGSWLIFTEVERVSSVRAKKPLTISGGFGLTVGASSRLQAMVEGRSKRLGGGSEADAPVFPPEFGNFPEL